MSAALSFEGPTLLTWCRVKGNWPGASMVYAGAMRHQVLFVRDRLPMAFAADLDEYQRHSGALEDGGTVVAGTHRSKSITLPVYGLDIRSIGVRAVVRANFYNWKVSVEAPRAVDLSVLGPRLNLSDPVHPVYCEGFREEWVLGPHAEHPARFTAELANEHDVYAVFLLIAHQMRGRS